VQSTLFHFKTDRDEPLPERLQIRVCDRSLTSVCDARGEAICPKGLAARREAVSFRTPT
jgi:hypothetical protein